MSDIGRAVREQAKSVCWDMAITGYSLLQRDTKNMPKVPLSRRTGVGASLLTQADSEKESSPGSLHIDIPEVCHGMQYF